MKKTEWFPIGTYPVRDGLYQTLIDGGVFWCFWENGGWCRASASSTQAALNTMAGRSWWQNRQWRGLAEEPK